MDSQASIPDMIVHYSRSEPFRSASCIATEHWPLAIKELNESNTWGVNRFFDSEYLPRRKKVEEEIRHEFVKKGGKPQLAYPLYFFLGRNREFEKHPLNKAHLIALKELGSEVISFTYGDSLLAFDQDYRSRSAEGYKSSLCAKTFKKEDLKFLFSQKDLHESSSLHIEAQLWIMPSWEIVNLLAV